MQLSTQKGCLDLILIKVKYRQSAVLTDLHTKLSTSMTVPFSGAATATAMRTGTRVWNWALPNERLTSAHSPIPDLRCYHAKHPQLPLSALHFTHVLPTLPWSWPGALSGGPARPGGASRLQEG